MEVPAAAWVGGWDVWRATRADADDEIRVCVNPLSGWGHTAVRASASCARTAYIVARLIVGLWHTAARDATLTTVVGGRHLSDMQRCAS